MERLVGLGLLRIAGVCAVAVALGALVRPRPPMFAPSHGQVLVGAAVAAAVLALLAVLRTVVRRTGAAGRLRASAAAPLLADLVPLAVSIGGAAVSTWLALQLRYRVTWDVQTVEGISRNVTSGIPLDEYQAGYLSRYPNTLGLLTLDNLCRTVSDSTGLSFGVVWVLLNGICLAVTLQAVHLLGVRLRSRVAGLAAQGLVLLLVGLSPWMTVGYTDVVALPFTVLAVLLLVRMRHTGNRTTAVLLLVGAAACAVVAIQLKSTPVVLVAAGGLYGLHEIAHRRSRHRATAAAALTGGLVLVAAGLLGLQAAAPALAGVPAAAVDRNRTPPLVWWFAMGTSERVVGGQVRYGGYDPGLVGLTKDMDADQAGRVATAYLTTRMHDLGPGGYVAFLGNKAVFTWGDGTFWAWNEGSDWRAESFTFSAPADFVRSWNRAGYPWWTWRAAAATGLWCVLLLGLGVRLLRAPLRRDTLLVALSLLGFAAFTLLSQGRSRYVLVAVPLVAVLAASLPPALRLRPRRTRAADPPPQPGADGAPDPAQTPPEQDAGQPATVSGTPCAGDSPTSPPSTVSSGAPR